MAAMPSNAQHGRNGKRNVGLRCGLIGVANVAISCLLFEPGRDHFEPRHTVKRLALGIANVTLQQLCDRYSTANRVTDKERNVT